jgi:hypothetical protein
MPARVIERVVGERVDGRAALSGGGVPLPRLGSGEGPPGIVAGRSAVEGGGVADVPDGVGSLADAAADPELLRDDRWVENDMNGEGRLGARKLIEGP